ncbi:MAG: hypothetical protein ACYC8T_39610, partial [Myxococcaceae bacterium]
SLAPLPCRPNLDGRIDASELQAALGVPASYVVSPAGAGRPIAVAGTVDGAGHRVWDWSVDLADDQLSRLTATPLAGKWYAGSFPAGVFVTALDAAGTLEAVYSHDGTALWLHGMASVQETPAQNKTLLVYTQPVALYRFPVQPDKSWVSAGEVRNGTIRGLPYAGRDTYQVTIDAAGRLQLPDFTFTQALRSRTRLTVEPAVGASVVRRQVSFLFECFGEVARATSLDNETRDDFTTAGEVRRLGL